jgi:hypothetical protein
MSRRRGLSGAGAGFLLYGLGWVGWLWSGQGHQLGGGGWGQRRVLGGLWLGLCSMILQDARSSLC